ncbi:MAG: endonuclease/exonuclease/phosphatase family protein [Candidatus Omnitrophota bacterium]
MSKITKCIFLIFLAISGILTVMGFLGRFGWLFDLASYFRMQYLLVQLLCIIFFVFFGTRKILLTALVLAGLNLILITPFYIHPSFRPVETRAKLNRIKIVSINVHTAIKDYQRLFGYIQKVDPDILTLDEINKTWFGVLSEQLEEYKFARFSDCGECKGIGVLSKIIPVRDKVSYFSKARIPLIELVFENKPHEFMLMFTHSICPDRASFFYQRNRHLHDLAVFIKKAGRNFVLVGDLNTGPWSYYFAKFLRQTGLRDGRLGFGVFATWRASLFLSAMIDQCLVGEGIVVLDYKAGPDIGSDHFPLCCEIGMAGV